MWRNTTNLFSKLLILTTFNFLVACGSVTPFNVKQNYSEQDLFADNLFKDPPYIPPIDEVFALTQKQKDHFLSEFHSKEYRSLSDSQRIFKYLQNQLNNYNFHSETLNATDAMALNSGNCMSLAILTKALSQLTHVGISYELARTPPVFQREGNLELNSQHIRAEVYNKTTKMSRQFLRPNDRVKIDYFSTLGSRTLRKVNKLEFHSLYYSNLAAEAMIRGDDNLTYWYLQEAIKVKKDNVIAINMLGVLYQRMGLLELAETAYQYGLSFGRSQLELLNNYHKFLIANNRLSEAKVIANELTNYNDPDPFKWLDLADREFKLNNYRKSIKLYEKAIEKANYLHQPYAGLAKAYFQLGYYDKASKAMELAMEHVHNRQNASIYQAKYNLIQKQLQPK